MTRGQPSACYKAKTRYPPRSTVAVQWAGRRPPTIHPRCRCWRGHPQDSQSQSEENTRGILDQIRRSSLSIVPATDEAVFTATRFKMSHIPAHGFAVVTAARMDSILISGGPDVGQLGNRIQLDKLEPGEESGLHCSVNRWSPTCSSPIRAPIAPLAVPRPDSHLRSPDAHLSRLGPSHSLCAGNVAPETRQDRRVHKAEVEYRIKWSTLHTMSRKRISQ